MNQRKLLSVVVPAYNEDAVLDRFHQRMSVLFDALPAYRCEMIFINDGSRDGTQAAIERLCQSDPRVAGVHLSRNFGKEIAITAGLDHATGDAVAVIDVDLQDPPELLTEMLRRWEEGYDMIYARRRRRDGESWLKKATAHAFYRLMNKLSRVDMPQDTGDFRLMSRRAVNALLSMREQHRFMKGLFAWVGFRGIAVEYDREPRAGGVSKFNYWQLWNLALEGITSFTIAPLKLATYLGLATAGLAFSYGAWIIVKTLAYGESVRGYPTLMVTLLFLGGVQLFFTGVLGEYLGRVFDESKHRPLYFAQEVWPSKVSREGSEPGC